MISLILFALAASCNAVMDTLTHHYYYSVFLKFDKFYWNPDLSWRNKYVDNDPNKPIIKWWIFDKPVTDGWHLFKSIMIICICGSIITFPSHLILNHWHSLIAFIIYGLVWNLPFNLLYNHLLIKK